MSRRTQELTQDVRVDFGYGAITLCSQVFQPSSPINRYTYEVYQNLMVSPTTPTLQRLVPYIESVWADPRSLAATEGIAIAYFS